MAYRSCDLSTVDMGARERVSPFHDLTCKSRNLPFLFQPLSRFRYIKQVLKVTLLLMLQCLC